MIGGETEVVERLDPIFKTHRPRSRLPPSARPGRTRTDGTAANGYLHCGPNGAGHFVKMVHNGIEYGMMAAFAEGLQHHQATPMPGQENPRSRRRRDGPVARAGGLPIRHRACAAVAAGLAARIGGRVVAGRPRSPTRSRVRRTSTGSPGGSRTPGERPIGRCWRRWTWRRSGDGRHERHCMSGSSREGLGDRSRTRSCLRVRGDCGGHSRRGTVGRQTRATSSKLWPTPGRWPRPERRSSPRAPVPRGRARGSFHFAVSGGHTPWAMFAELASQAVPWDAVVLYQVDERSGCRPGGPGPGPRPSTKALGRLRTGACDAGQRGGSDGPGSRPAPPRCPGTSIWSTSVSAPTGTPDRSCRRSGPRRAHRSARRARAQSCPRDGKG